MNEKLKMKPSGVLIFSRILAAILVLTLAGVAFFGIVDFRTQEQKDADARQEFLEKSHSQAALKGLRGAYRESLGITPERIVVFNATGKLYVAVLSKDSIGMYTTFYYNATDEKEIDSWEYDKAYNSIASYHNFTGSKMQTTKIENEELQILCEEVWK